VRLQQGLREEYPDDPASRVELAASFNLLGELSREGGRPLAEAEAFYRQARDQLWERIKWRDLDGLAEGERPGLPKEYARALYNLGIVCHDSNRPDEARLNYDGAVRWLESLNAAEPDDREHRHGLARDLLNRGVL